MGIFVLLDQESLTASQISSRLQADSRFVGAFIEACVALNLLQKKEDVYTNAETASVFLVPDKPGYVGSLVLHITNYWHSWGNLDRLICEGRTELPFENGFTDAATYWQDYMEGQHNRAVAGQSDNLVQNVNLSTRKKMLDLGGGAASYSIALCKANPQLTSYVIDAKEPLAIARPLVAEQNLQERVFLIEDDMNSVELESDYDTVLISGVVLIKSEDECRRIFRRAYDALLPGGLIIVQDFMRIDHSEKRHFLDTMMDLYVLLGFAPQAGDRYGDEYAAWLIDTGFIHIKQIPLPTHLALITAEK